MKKIKNLKDCKDLITEIKAGRIIKVNRFYSILYIGNGNYIYQSVRTDRMQPEKYLKEEIKKIIWKERKSINANGLFTTIGNH